MPDLILRFDCNDAEIHADDFQHFLVDKKILLSRVEKEERENEIWLNYPNLPAETIEHIRREAHQWSGDRGLGVLEGTGEGRTSQATVLMIADLAKVME
ncbi:MAG TPA: hypothetical protein VKF39_05610 [Nitrososphaerales archaeon]|nr:hypothetical protein [Nitrososphaerales archaeon]